MQPIDRSINPFLQPELTKEFKLPVPHQICMESPVFQEYRSKLVNAVQNALKVLGLTKLSSGSDSSEYTILLVGLIKHIMCEPGNDFESLLDYHKSAIRDLRILSIKNRQFRKEKKKLNNEEKFVAWLCVWMYSRVNLNSSIDAFFNVHPDLKMDFSGSCAEVMQRLSAQIYSSPSFGGSFQVNPYKDDHFNGQLPFTAFTLKNCPSTQVLYNVSLMADIKPMDLTVDIKPENQDLKVKFIPEFCEFLYEIGSGKKTYLNIVLLDHLDDDEKAPYRMFEIMDNIFNNLFVIFLDQNSVFYLQPYYFGNAQPILKFKRLFFNQMFAAPGNSFYFFSKKIDRTLLENMFDIAFNKVRRQHFFKVENLTLDDRKIFIDLVHIQMIEGICAKFKINFCGVSCNNLAERTGGMLSLLHIHQIMKSETVITDEEIKKTTYLQFASSLLSHNRAPLDFILERTILTIDHFQKTKIKFKNRPKKNFNRSRNTGNAASAFHSL